MHLLVVHQEEEIGQALQLMVQEYTAHTAACVGSERAAREWADHAPRCDLLVTQLESEGLDGLEIAGSLGQRFPGLHTFFCPLIRSTPNGSKSRTRKFFSSRSTASACCRRSNAPPPRRERQTFFISSTCFRCVA